MPEGIAGASLGIGCFPEPPDCRSDRRRRYHRYISSAAWRNSPARLAELAASGGRCRLCARTGPDVRIEVHHNTYAHLGCEAPADLCTLCADCHRTVTGELRRRRYADFSCPAFVDTPRLVPGRALREPSAC